MPSFDVVSKLDLAEVDNAINQAKKEIGQRYDFRGAATELERSDEGIILRSADKEHLHAAYKVVMEKMVKRGVSLGAGYISKSWLFNGSVDILLGPYEPTRGERFDVDFYGTGATLWLGFSAQTLDLRSPEGGYGFALGLSYADTVGRSAELSSGATPDYVMHVTNLSLVPGLFFSWLKPARPRGNTPELLTTRLEGEVLSFGMAMPLISSYSATYESEVAPRQSVTEKGRLRGYSLTLSLTGFLGI